MSRAKTHYEARVVEILSRVYKREGDFLVTDPVCTETPLTELLEKEASRSTRVDPEWLPSDLQELRDMDQEGLLALVTELMDERDDHRRRTLKALMSFFFSRGPDPVAVAEMVFMLADALHEEYTWRMNGTEMAELFGRSKQDWQSLREKFIEDLVRRWNREETVLGGGKSWSARQAYAAQKRGNTSRKLGRKKGDELPRGTADDDDGMKLSRAAKARAERLRQEAERRELAREIGCKPEEIDLQRITPRQD